MKKVLIVDDSSLARKMIRRIFEKMEYEIAGEAESGEQALLQYRKTMPDIVTMDIVMKGMNGMEAAKSIIKVFPDAKIIIVSSHGENNLKAELLGNGLKYLVVKPVDEAKLSDAVRKITSGDVSNITLDDSAEKKLRTEVRSFLSNIAKEIQEKVLYEENELKVGCRVSVNHYFTEQLLTGTIEEIYINSVVLSFDREMVNYNFSVEDPLIIGFNAKTALKICEASINEVNINEKRIKVKLLKVNLLNDTELDEFYPVTLPADFKDEYLNKKQSAILKNLGPYNQKILSKAELDVGEKINFSVYLEEKIISMSSEIISRNREMDLYEYELKTVFIDLNSKKFMKFYIQKARELLEKFMLGMSVDI